MASGTSLWDSEASAGAVPRLIRLTPDKSLMNLLVTRGLLLWFNQCEPREFARAVERRSKEVVLLPKPLFNALSDLAQRPDSFKRGSRKHEHTAVLGPACSGHRIDALFAQPEARALLQVIAERNASKLDTAFAKRKLTLTENPTPELGVLLEFTNVQLFVEAPRVAKWKSGFAAMSERTTEARPFWDEYGTKIETLFSMLTPPG